MGFWELDRSWTQNKDDVFAALPSQSKTKARCAFSPVRDIPLWADLFPTGQYVQGWSCICVPESVGLSAPLSLSKVIRTKLGEGDRSQATKTLKSPSPLRENHTDP